MNSSAEKELHKGTGKERLLTSLYLILCSTSQIIWFVLIPWRKPYIHSFSVAFWVSFNVKTLILGGYWTEPQTLWAPELGTLPRCWRYTWLRLHQPHARLMLHQAPHTLGHTRPQLHARYTLHQAPHPSSPHPFRPCWLPSPYGMNGATPHLDPHPLDPAGSPAHQNLCSLCRAPAVHETATSPSLLGSLLLGQSQAPVLQAYQITAPPGSCLGQH
jgi:hypothetical protein